MNKKLNFNWLAIVASSIFASLLLNTVAEANELSATVTRNHNSTLTSEAALEGHRSVSPQLIAARKKKRIKRKVRVRRKVKPVTTSTSPTTSPSDVTQTPPAPAAPEVTPPPAPAEPSVTREEVEALRKSNQELREELLKVDTKAAESEKKIEQLDKQQFSQTSKLQGFVIFGLSGAISGDFDRNPFFGQRSRLEFVSDVGGGTLTTRLQSVGMGLANQTGTTPTPEGGLSWTDGTLDGTVNVDALKYQFDLGAQTQVTVIANAGAADDFADTINPYFDGDGNSGAISAFANRPSIYYTIQGAGVGLRHKLSDSVEVSLGYLANQAPNPQLGFGLFNGGYGALAQVAFKTGENSKIGLTYTNSYNSDPGTGSNNAALTGTSNSFGVQSSFQLSPEFALGGWVGYTQNRPTGGGDRQIWNWAVTAAAPDFGGKGNVAGLLVGQSPRVASASNSPTDSKAGLHIEGFYQIKVNDNVSITPGLIYLSAPDHSTTSNSALIGALRTTFSF